MELFFDFYEKLNGKGYPFHLSAADLDTGARIMAVADIFSAITEVRPYRAGMSREEAFTVLSDNVKSGGIDGELVSLLGEHYEEIDHLREEAARSEGERYYKSMATRRRMSGRMRKVCRSCGISAETWHGC